VTVTVDEIQVGDTDADREPAALAVLKASPPLPGAPALLSPRRSDDARPTRPSILSRRGMID